MAKLIEKKDSGQQEAVRREKNFPNFEQGNIVIGTLGPATAQAVRDAGLRLDIEAPSPQYPSISSAIDDHLRKANG